MNKQQKGFTLIELLIVVAIIAILAAIAVPNFLEAQTRAKVSRAKADQRSMATAIESYVVDNNDAPITGANWIVGKSDADNYYQDAWPTVPAGTNTEEWGWSHLTTPISYIGSIPKDPFRTNYNQGHYQQAANGYHYYETLKWVKWRSKSGDMGPYYRAHFKRAYEFGHPWVLASAAPFRMAMYTGRYNPNDGCNVIQVIAANPAYVWKGMTVTPKVDGIYDPTNGTVSFGWIIRTGKGVLTVGG